jgi:hypothetical protein
MTIPLAIDLSPLNKILTEAFSRCGLNFLWFPMEVIFEVNHNQPQLSSTDELRFKNAPSVRK